MIRFLFVLPLLFTSPLQAAPPERLIIGAEAGKGVAIVDPADKNKVLWHHPIKQVHILHLLPDDTILTQDGWPLVVEFDLGKNTVWSYDAITQNRDDGLSKVEIHAAQRFPDGTTMIAESGSSRILEVKADGTIVKEFPLAVSSPSAHSDTRQVHRLENGHYLVAHEADQTVKEYNADGKAIWEFPVPLFGKEPKKGHGPDAFGGKCFSAIKAENGNYLITTGNGHSVLEVTPEKEIVWKLEQNDLEGITLAWVTTIEERENGNLMIGNCHAGPDNPQIIEITRDKEVVWTFHDFDTFGNSLANTLVIDGDRAKALRAKLASHP
ncbi:MAG: PQQ-binding-like beta-propeller repeat protein [Verrucomicrobiales bacterium]|nr:PQQ-binding-like beta-propeller repeat protein [Verrucomicrobiales bacterium]